MSWFRVFSAVLAANLVTAVIGLVLSIFLMAGAVGVSVSAIQNELFGGHVTFGGSSSVVDQDAVDAMNRQLALQRQEADQQQRQNQLRRENQQNADRINQETCAFWSQQVRDNPNSKNIAYRDSACSRL